MIPRLNLGETRLVVMEFQSGVDFLDGPAYAIPEEHVEAFLDAYGRKNWKVGANVVYLGYPPTKFSEAEQWDFGSMTVNTEDSDEV